MKRFVFSLAVSVGLMFSATAMAVDVQGFVKKDKFNDIKISPTGEYLAATVPLQDRTVLAVIRRSDNKLMGNFGLGKNTHVSRFVWVNPDRVLIGIAEKFGSLDQPIETGEIFVFDAKAGKGDSLVGFRVADNGLGTKIKPKQAEEVAGFLVDDLPNDDRNVIVSIQPFSRDPVTRAERLDVYSGRRVPITIAPARRASFVTDNRGVVRYAYGLGPNNERKLFHRADDKAKWELVSDDSGTGLSEWPVGFSADDRVVYMEVEQATGPNILVSVDPATGKRTTLLRDDASDPIDIVYRLNSSIPVGAFFAAGKPRTAFFDNASEEARLYRSLESAFEGSTVDITSVTKDGRTALVHVTSDRNPGDFYLFDTTTKKADFLLGSRDWFDPETLNPVRPVRLDARDGLALHGFVTLPHGSSGKNLPMIVLPHGGPFQARDDWSFDEESQMLASAGYAVLRLNFRGSPGFGRSFKTSGAKQWGGTMQDDLTDATRWAIAQGIADAGRICIYGASYGAYASLMGAAKEPGLYRCAAGYVGVYDLPMMVKADSRHSKRSSIWMSEWVGAADELASTSPNRIADRIRTPVFLAAGGEDEIAPIEHTKRMEAALRKAGVPVEALYYNNEGHGFYVEKNRVEYYTKLLAFFSTHLGGRVAGGSGGRDAASK